MKRGRTMDICFVTARVAVFVDGCFWHGCAAHGTWPRANAEFWRAKIMANRARDLETTEILEAAGWQVVRVWGHDSVDESAQRIATMVASRSRDRARPVGSGSREKRGARERDDQCS